jgi:glutamate dehydrogenase (NADP+)
MSKNDSELESVAAFMEWVEQRHPGETEFHQAVQGVAENVLDLAREHSGFRRQRVLQRLTEPDRSLSFRVVWADDEGRVNINRGYRIQHCNAIGPYKGGLRFDPDLTVGTLKFLAFEQTLKNSLTGMNLGGGKGGADFDPRGRSEEEIQRFCQSFMTELHRHIGPMTDVPAGDIGVGEREIGFLFGQYKRLENQFSGALTGKAVDAGGSHLREQATGYGAVYFLCGMLEEMGREIGDQRITISGAGNVATYLAEKAAQLGAKVLTLSNRKGFLLKEDGLTEQDVCELRERYRSSEDLAEAAESVGARWMEGVKPWDIDCDVAAPSATQNELDGKDARKLVENGCSVVVEAANMPLTREAAKLFDEEALPIGPGKAANAGGVAVSGFEMSQNRTGRSWSCDRLDEELRDIMSVIFGRVRAEAEIGGRLSYCRGADRAGFRRVADALVWLGLT